MSFDKPIIVIIPGAFHKPDNYKLVIEPLRSQGYKVLSAPLTVTSDSVRANLDQDDDASALLAELVRKLDEDKEAILVSHSYGGVVVAASIGGQTVTKRQARRLKGGVRAVVNIAGFAFPARGKNIIGTDAPVNPMPYWLIKEGVVHLQEDAKPNFYSGLSPKRQDEEWASILKQQSLKSFTIFPSYIESEFQAQKIYFLTEEDQAIPPPFQEQVAKTGVYDEIVKIPSGHSPSLQCPERLVEEILKIASQ